MMQQIKQKIYSVFLIVTVVAVFVILFGKIKFDTQQDTLYVLNDGWEITLNDEPLPVTSLQDVNETVRMNDTFVMKSIMPAETLPAATLRLYSIHSSFEVYLDDELLYSYGDDYMEAYGFVPQGFTLVPVPEGYEGRQLTLIYTALEDQPFTGFKLPLLGALESVIRFWMDETSIMAFAGVYLLMFGFMTSVIAIFTLFFYNQKTKALAGGILSMNIGMMALAYTNALFFLTPDLLVTSMIEYISQLLLVITVFALAKSLPVGKSTRRFFNICFLAGIVSFFAALILQSQHIVPLPTYLIHYQRAAAVMTLILCLIMGVTIVRMIIGHYEKRKIGSETDTSEKANFLLYASFLVLVAFLLMEVVFYHLLKYVFGNESSYSHAMFVIGIAGFSVLIFLSYLFNDIALIQERNQSERLEKMAYTDALTGLYNKAFCDNALKKLTEARTHFSVLMMDVNHLKVINDTQGHEAGDELLRVFAEIISEKFRKTDILCRTGGDEFIVLMANGSAQMCKARIRELTAYLMQVNESNQYPFSISVAMGYALSSELSEYSPEAIFKLADERMYEIKREIHGESSC